jgi:prevent-host-death family protein
MKISADIKPISFLKSKAADMLKQVNETHRPIIITQNGEPRAVLQDPESYENMRNAIGLMKLISLGEEDILKDKSKKQDEVFSALEKLVGS